MLVLSIVKHEARANRNTYRRDRTMRDRIPGAQERALLRKHLTGDFGVHCWLTIDALMRRGLVAEKGKLLVVTDAGRAYCDCNHASIRLTA